MCGLVGFKPFKDKKVDWKKICLMAVGNEERGTDSCGISIGTDILKCTKYSKARDFLWHYEDLIREKDTVNMPIILHTRKSSAWNKKEEKHAHPFQFGDLVGAHNGTITNERSLLENFIIPKNADAKYMDYEVDSEFLLEAIRMQGHKFKDVLKKYDGKAALIWHNGDKFHAWKGGMNEEEERPLFYSVTKEGIYFCSIASTLYLATGVSPVSLKNNELLSVVEDKLFSCIIERKKVIPSNVVVYNAHPTYFEPKRDLMGFRYVDEKGLLLNKTLFYGYQTFTDKWNFVSTSKTPFYEHQLECIEGVMIKSHMVRQFNTLRSIREDKLRQYVEKNEFQIADMCFSHIPIYKKKVFIGIIIKLNEMEVQYYSANESFNFIDKFRNNIRYGASNNN